MKRVILLTAIACTLAISASAQRKQLRQFTNEHCSVAETHRIGLSFLPLRIVSWFIPGTAFDGDAREVKLLLKKVKSVKLWTIQMDNGEPVSPESIAQLKKDLYAEGKFESLMEIRHPEGHVQLLSNAKSDDRIDNLVALIHEDGEMIMVHLKTKLSMDDLSRIANRINNRVKEEEDKKREEIPVAKDNNVASAQTGPLSH
ncbi:DUF4252 domain-containing protein [Chitinophaga sp. GCM10012297]|uniref:DUF4252 domain-containing protein n=1 Tax=Chitinophaga chungangae TaxID=2821488 RepID=A0ABS3YI56_9BACT|nr:DUF4252 domain-containing protein [Chitinophaga chungangae]MBO9154342.1 DUF4252 domain-containing protein [Chitinophaga chungangae]